MKKGSLISGILLAHYSKAINFQILTILPYKSQKAWIKVLKSQGILKIATEVTKFGFTYTWFSGPSYNYIALSMKQMD